MKFNLALISKYDKPGPRYTSYPPATFFTEGLTREEYIRHLLRSNEQSPRNLSFYFHVPFCPQLCHFCGCNTGGMQKKSFIDQYINAVKKEFITVSHYLAKERPVTQIHWGGGTPNSIATEFIFTIMQLVTEHFTLSDQCEIAMECNPAYLSYQQADELINMGFNRLSLGIQDFNQTVLHLINRRLPLLPIQDIIAYLRNKGIATNLDFVYGLPGQTPISFADTMRQAIDISPDRIVTFSYAHVPWVKEAQKILEQYTLPSPSDKLLMFENAYNLLTDNGYVAIGLDHFAKPQDDMAKSLEKKTLHRNFMGYCTRENTGQVYAFGSTSISQLWDVYAQNRKNTEDYIKAIETTGFALEKGYRMTFQNLVCREVIQEIMCNHFLDLAQVAVRFNLTVSQLQKTLNFDPETLKPLSDDGLIAFSGNTLQVKPEGRLFLRNVAMLFDPLYASHQTLRYSKTV